jgi:hypothetical protein
LAVERVIELVCQKTRVPPAAGYAENVTKDVARWDVRLVVVSD